MEPLDPDQLEFLVQFRHPEKILGDMPGMNETMVAALFGMELPAYQAAKEPFQQRVREAGDELLSDPECAKALMRLPFQAGERVVGFGDSITSDYQSWLEILRYLLAQQPAYAEVALVNGGVSGDTTSLMISRFHEVLGLQPDWILCMAGTNDARLHGPAPTKTLVSLQETAANLRMLRQSSEVQASAQWIWITPARVDETSIAVHPFLSEKQMRWRNEDLEAIAEVVRQQSDPVVDLQPHFRDPELLLPDGLHPSIAGQKVIVKTLLRTLSGLPAVANNKSI